MLQKSYVGRVYAAGPGPNVAMEYVSFSQCSQKNLVIFRQSGWELFLFPFSHHYSDGVVTLVESLYP